jgi:hypothetical protein
MIPYRFRYQSPLTLPSHAVMMMPTGFVSASAPAFQSPLLFCSKRDAGTFPHWQPPLRTRGYVDLILVLRASQTPTRTAGAPKQAATSDPLIRAAATIPP